MKARAFVFALLIFGAACATKTSQTTTGSQIMAEAVPKLIAFEYPESTENFPNPERGFAYQSDVVWPEKTPWGFCAQGENFAKYDYVAWNTPFKLEFLKQERAQGRAVMQVRYHIADFRKRDLTPEYLAFLQRDFETTREAGIKLVVRFAYNYPMGGPDAALPIILRHIKQLQPVLTKNADVIAYLEAGFVGCWGEWHHSSNGLTADGPPNEGFLTAAQRQIIDALLLAVPPERMIALRYPNQKFDYFGSQEHKPIAPLTTAQAWNKSSRSRIGHQEDCFVCSPTHGGSYINPRGDPSEIPRFLERENLFVVQGGEPGDPESIFPSEPPNVNSVLASCETILKEMTQIRWSVMGLFNIGAKYSVIQRWKRDGCHDEIARRLGYRFRLLKSELPKIATRGGTLQAKFTLVNDGYANLYNPRMLELVLRHQASRKLTRLKLMDDARFKMPFPGESKILEFNLKLPATLERGTYDVLLALPDSKPSLHDRPEYAIQLANKNVWEANTGFNNLGHKLEVQ
jgi:Domain of unknown function (DUF4832)/Domain of unknown function (DUF4874)